MIFNAYKFLECFLVTILLCITLALGGCSSFSNFQTARVLPQKQADIYIASSGMFGADVKVPPVFPEIGFRMGLGFKSDVGARISLGGLYADYKYQLLGNEDGKIAVATGLELGGTIIPQSGTSGFIQTTLPLHFSYHPSERAAIIFTPKICRIFGFKELTDYDSGENYFDGSSSFLFSLNPGFEFLMTDRLKLIAGGNIIFDLTGDQNFFQYGIGIKYVLRGNRK
jgi:hypothetical protein